MITHETGENECFFCHNSVNGPGVEWTEANNYAENPTAEGRMKLHLCPRCSIQLGCRLIGDGFNADPSAVPVVQIQQWVDRRLR